MTIRTRRSKRYEIIELFKARNGLTRSQVATAVGISYAGARYHLERLVEDAILVKRVHVYSLNKRGVEVRRITYFTTLVTPPSDVYYRTQLALLFYTETPRNQTPDPIAEFRVTVVSDKKLQYSPDELKIACIYVGVILAPQTWWARPEDIKNDKPAIKHTIRAWEYDEPIDKDELKDSVPVYGRLNYAERQAVFFKSKKYSKWQTSNPLYWLSRIFPNPQTGDYLYNEDIIKKTEQTRVNLKTLKVIFDNIKGRMESVLEEKK